MKKVEIIRDGAPISREPGNFPTLSYYGWPSVALDENEVTYVVVSKRLRHIDPYGKVMMYRSYDKGLSWDAGVCLIDTVIDDRDAGILYMGNGRFMVTTFSHDYQCYLDLSKPSWSKWQSDVGPDELQKRLDLWESVSPDEKTGCSSYIISDDYGKTWSHRKLMPITAPHGPSLLKNGDVMYLGVPKAPEFATGKPLDEGVYCYLSHDRGEHFELYSQLPVDASYKGCEAYGIELQDGSIVASIRTGDFHTLILRSTDGGKTWTEPYNLTYGAPAHLIEEKDGTVIITYSKRGDITGQVIRLSFDRAETFSAEQYISRPLSENDADLGYPATAQYSDGSFITVYYQKFEEDVKPSLMRTIWKF